MILSLEDEWFTLEQSSSPELGEHAWDEPYFMLKNCLAEQYREKNELFGKIIKLSDKHPDEEPENWETYLWNEIAIAEIRERVVKLNDLISRNELHLGKIEYRKTPYTKSSISQAEIDQAKKVPLSEILGTEGKRSASRRILCCPFHEEKTPSFTIYPDNHWHCFSCGKTGDSISLVMHISSLSFIQAIKSLL